MSLVFKVGDHEDMQKVPHNFPRCGDWKSSFDERNANNLSENTAIQNVTYVDTRENDVNHRIPLLLENIRRLTSSSSNLNISTSLLILYIIISILLK